MIRWQPRKCNFSLPNKKSEFSRIAIAFDSHIWFTFAYRVNFKMVTVNYRKTLLRDYPLFFFNVFPVFTDFTVNATKYVTAFSILCQYRFLLRNYELKDYIEPTKIYFCFRRILDCRPAFLVCFQTM